MHDTISGAPSRALSAGPRRALLACGLAALSACSGSPSQGSLEVQQAWIRETTTGVAIGAGYAKIDNRTAQAVRLIEAKTPVAGKVELHSVTHDRGVMQMRPVAGGLEIASGGSVDLKPGGYHLMLLGLKRPLRAGETVPMTLTFAGAASMEIGFAVRPAADVANGGTDHE